MTRKHHIARRDFLLLAAAGLYMPRAALAEPFREITWEDLIPPGVPYSEIIADGDRDEQTDTWNPVYDENGVKLNTELDGKTVKMPGFIIPLASSAEGVNRFMLVPYVGACIHVPPPPPNQLVFVTTETPWPNARLWDAVWVTGNMAARPQSTGIADSGYEIVASKIESYQQPNN